MLGGLCALFTLATLALAPRRCAAQAVDPPSTGNGWNALVARVGEKMITEHDVVTQQRAFDGTARATSPGAPSSRTDPSTLTRTTCVWP